MISPTQIRAARALLSQGQSELAELAGVSVRTIMRIEGSAAAVAGTAQTLMRIQRALEEAGVIFIDQDLTHGAGVRLRDRRT